MSERLKMLWVDLTVASRGSRALPIGIETRFDIERFGNVEKLDLRLESSPPQVVGFDFDYPDREGLQLMVAAKNTHRSIPMIMVTLQHSEKLAVWAFRNKLVDFLVKPVPQADIERCHRMLSEMFEARSRQETRTLAHTEPRVPADVGRAARSIDKAFLPAIYHVAQNFGTKIQNDEAANLCSMSPFRFSRGFKEVFGISFREYIIRYRLREACRLLKNPYASVTDVAFAVGFSDVSYFSKMFKRHIGVSPSEAGLSDLAEGQDFSPSAVLRIPPDLLRDHVA